MSGTGKGEKSGADDGGRTGGRFGVEAWRGAARTAMDAGAACAVVRNGEVCWVSG